MAEATAGNIWSLPSPPSILRKLVSYAIIYATWKQGNNVLHNNHRPWNGGIINSINAHRHGRNFSKLMGF
ncbi:hypothetical protein CARUB_v10006246mg [Capsella rubella]|uniref:Uncharacterized protein n=1 Tax=Capsella rubella TaxID=81985 RepID=R0F7G8_9BRAS|nr:hypothetical protein CARUB_v10006246mg [Capsella rubella]